MNRFVLSALTVLLATSAAAPMAQAAEETVYEGDAFSLHQVRLAEFDQRNKADKKSPDLTLHQRRLSAFDQRNKFGIKDPNFSVQAVRLAELDQRNKSDDKGEFNLAQIARENRDLRNKATVK
ncbi:MAG: hypothetical protein WA783_13585 [Phormidesmis sp.]